MIVLASASEARKRLLGQAGVKTVTDPSHIDEAAVKSGSPISSFDELALVLSKAKALAVSPRHPGQLILAADQILECNGHLFDKPGNPETARQQLKSLRGRKHRLISAAVLVQDGKVRWQHVDQAHLTMRDFSEDFLSWYLGQEGEAIFNCVGAYRVEGLGAQLFEKIEGDHFTVQGLPLLPLLEALRGMKECVS